MDYVGARMLGYEPAKIPIVAHAWERFRWPITSFGPGEVRLEGDAGEGAAVELIDPEALPYSVDHPIGWRDAAAGAVQPLAMAG